MSNKKTRQELAKLGSAIVSKARKQLRTAPTRKGSPYHGSHEATGALLSEFGMEVESNDDGTIYLALRGPEYLDELDQGQSGTGITYPTEYTFDASVREIREWLTAKDWEPKSVGSYRYSDTLQSASENLQKKLKYSGVRPTYFLTNPLKEELTKSSFNAISKAWADDSVDFIINNLDNAWKK